jgi:transcriptional regulator with XRE-family HTH domain
MPNRPDADVFNAGETVPYRGSAMAFEDRGPNPVDVYVGARVRNRRKFLGLSQETLAASIDLTFQQVQKYERGSNRISASKLHLIAKTLKVPMNYFFDGAPDGDNEAAAGPLGGSSMEQTAHDFLSTAEGVELAQYFPRVGNARARRKVLDLVRSLAED